MGEKVNHFGAMLQRMRTERGYSSRQFATECGLSRETVRLYESGGSAPSNQSLMKMFVALNVDPDVDQEAKQIIASVCKERSDKKLAKKRAFGPSANSELKKFITETEVDADKVDRLLNLFFENLDGKRTDSIEYFIRQNITKILED